MIMKQATQLLRDILPVDLQTRLDDQSDSLTEYAEPGFSLSLLKRLNDRLTIARRRIDFADDSVTKYYLAETIKLLELVKSDNNCPVWQGYYMDGKKRVEFILAPSLSRRVIVKFETS